MGWRWEIKWLFLDFIKNIAINSCYFRLFFVTLCSLNRIIVKY